jgi:hypothetical protein
MFEDGITRGRRDELTKGLFANNVGRENGRDGLKDDFHFTKIGGTRGEENIISIGSGCGVNRSLEIYRSE